MKRSMLFLVVGVIIGAALVVAEDFRTPHQLRPGDVISADVINEALSHIKNTNRSVTGADLLGTWSCKAYDIDQLYKAVDGWSLSDDGLYMALANATIAFGNTDGYSLTTSVPNPFCHEEAAAHASAFAVIGNHLILHPDNDPDGHDGIYLLQRVSPTRIVLSWVAGHARKAAFLVLDKQNLPPAIPTQLSATASGLSITLSWTDASDDETGFTIVRRDTLEGEYAEIGTADADATTYEDALTEAGTYWYRVKATNANGDSLGSNVVKVTVE